MLEFICISLEFTLLLILHTFELCLTIFEFRLFGSNLLFKERFILLFGILEGFLQLGKFFFQVASILAELLFLLVVMILSFVFRLLEFFILSINLLLNEWLIFIFCSIHLILQSNEFIQDLITLRFKLILLLIV